MKRYLLMLALCSAVVVNAPPVLAADTTPPQVLDLTITPSTVTITGAAYTKVVVSVHLQDDSGICSSPTTSTCNVDTDWTVDMPGYPTPLVKLDDPSFAPGMREETTFSAMRLTSGTTTDGWWSMTRLVTGLWTGRLPAIRIAAFDTAGNKTDIDPYNTPLGRTLVVYTSYRPHVTYGFVPSITPYGGTSFTVKGRAFLSDGGGPLGNRTLLLCQDNGCGIEGSYNGVAVRTNADGYYSVPAQRMVLGLMLFKTLGGGGPGQAAYPTTFYSNPLFVSRIMSLPRSAHYLTVKTVRPSTVVAAGSPVTIKGLTELSYSAYTPAYWRSVAIQRLVSGTWAHGTIVTEQTALIETTTVQAGIHTYTLVAHPPKGAWSYRVYRFSTPAYAPTARYLTLTGR